MDSNSEMQRIAGPLQRSEQHRVVVLGMSGAGKSSLARQLATKLAVPHVELDALFWGPEWTPKPAATFRELTHAAVSAPGWVVDGNYSSVRDIVWPRATIAVWLNLPFPIVLWRVFWRTMRRLLRREALWHGNRESFPRTFLSRESILWWVITAHGRRRREFALLRDSAQFQNLKWVELRCPAEVEGFLRDMDGATRHEQAAPGSSAARR